jgi:glycosyltransferase involved in cell wall biosynthesis
LKILFFIDSLRAGGKERRCTELLKSLNNIPSVEFEVVLMNSDVHYKDVFGLNTKVHYLIRKTKKDLSVFSRFYKICKTYKPDIVHCWEGMTATIAAPTCFFQNIKLVNGMVIDTPVKQNILNKDWLRAKLTFPFSDKIIGNSKAGLAAYGAPSKKAVCIYNGIDFNRFNNLKNKSEFQKEILGTDDNIFIIGMVAAFEARKDYKTLIDAALNLIKSNDSIRFILVGSGKDFPGIKKSVPEEFQDKIIFLGKRTDVESIANLFDIGVLLTNSKVHGEGISNSIIEYMALGKPVIATRGGGTSEAIIENENGYLLNANNSSELVAAIQKLVSNKNTREQFGKKSLQKAREAFDLKIMAKNYITLYQNLLSSNKN